MLASNITWINETDPANNFALFGSNADTARGVVEAAIETWERTVTGFNGQDLDIPLTISVDPNNGGTYAVGVGQYDETNNNIPVAGTVTINRGLGDIGWFFDETPLENSEYQGTLVNAFARQASSDVVGDNVDFYMTIVHEIGHVMGIAPSSPLLHDNRLFGPGFAGIQLNGIEQATLHANQFDNLFFIENAPGPTRYTVNGGYGDDTFFLASDSQNLSGFNTPLILNGGFDDDHLILYDQSAPFNPTYDVTANSVDRIGFGEFSFPSEIGVTFSSMSDVELFLNSGNNTVHVASTTAELTLNTAAGDDKIHLGNGVLEALSGLVTVNAGDDVDAIFLHDESDTGDDKYSIGSNWVTKPGFALDYNQVESLTLNANPFNNAIAVESTAANAPVTINAGGGGDTISISPASDNLADLMSDVIVNGQAGVDTATNAAAYRRSFVPIPTCVCSSRPTLRVKV